MNQNRYIISTRSYLLCVLFVRPMYFPIFALVAMHLINIQYTFTRLQNCIRDVFLLIFYCTMVFRYCNTKNATGTPNHHQMYNYDEISYCILLYGFFIEIIIINIRQTFFYVRMHTYMASQSVIGNARLMYRDTACCNNNNNNNNNTFCIRIIIVNAMQFRKTMAVVQRMDLHERIGERTDE